MDENLESWNGTLIGRRGNAHSVSIEAVIDSQSDSRGGALPFSALCSDGNVYWIKMISNRQSDRVPATEQIVSQCGAMILAPVCSTAVVIIPEEFEGESLDNGTVLSAGLAHGSRNVENASFDKWFEPQNRERDDNRKRHGGYYALYDWCWGDDMQWLYDLSDDWKTYSHDHGLFLPGGTGWTREKLIESVDSAHEIDSAAQGLDDTELERIADRLESLESEAILEILASIPESWPVSDAELETLGWFLFRRATGVARRLRLLAERNRDLQ